MLDTIIDCGFLDTGSDIELATQRKRLVMIEDGQLDEKAIKEIVEAIRLWIIQVESGQ